ncbi:hypothetical protein [Clostridium sardiniense]|uniref:hypothetical protein n=1 Tax=Clostridium sardiniense TaxID=29369 RepID=UPI00195B6603|nr:hypothetical protein [Clostridium sardiniense]MBM7836442.1 hypothetical protein [Clostridium sardiniense]
MNEKKQVNLNTKQGFDAMRIVNKLGVKDQILDVIDIMKNAERKQGLLYQEIIGYVTDELGAEKVKELREEENGLGVYILDQYKKHPEIKDQMDSLDSKKEKEILNVIFTIVIERISQAEKELYKFLANVYNIKPKEIEEQGFDETIHLIYGIITSETFQKLFTLTA